MIFSWRNATCKPSLSLIVAYRYSTLFTLHNCMMHDVRISTMHFRTYYGQYEMECLLQCIRGCIKLVDALN